MDARKKALIAEVEAVFELTKTDRKILSHIVNNNKKKFDIERVKDYMKIQTLAKKRLERWDLEEAPQFIPIPTEKSVEIWREAAESFVEESRLEKEFNILKKEGCYSCFFEFSDCIGTHRQKMCISEEIVFSKKEE